MKVNIKWVDLILTGAIAAGIALVVHHEIRKKQAQQFIRHLQNQADMQEDESAGEEDFESAEQNMNQPNRGDAD